MGNERMVKKEAAGISPTCPTTNRQVDLLYNHYRLPSPELHHANPEFTAIKHNATHE